MTLEMMKARQAELGYTNEKLAMLTETPKSTFDRRWKSDGKNLPYDFVVKCCFILGLSIDEDERTPTETSEINVPLTEVEHEEIMRHFADRLNEKNMQIEDQAKTIERLQNEVMKSHELFHELNHKNIERIDRLNAESKEREDRKNTIIRKQFRIITLLSVAVAVLAVFSIYFVIDAFNGDWGIVRYIMELMPDTVGEAQTGWADYVPLDRLCTAIQNLI